jgi:hypothetical protein
LKQFLSIIFVLLITSCSWVKDETDGCPYGFWLNLHYTYNILDVEAAPEYIKEVSVFIYDTEGNYVTRLDVSQADLETNSHRIRVEGIPEGDYQFVVWGGIGNSHYTVSYSSNKLEDFRLSLTDQDKTCSSQLPDLFYGYLPAVHYKDAYAEHHVYMMKNTNQLACLVVPMGGGVEINPDDFTMRIVSANGTMDAMNQLTSPKVITYEPFARDVATISDSDFGELHGVKFNMMTLRLMAQTDCRLILERKDTGSLVFNVSFPEYIGMIGSLYTNMGRQLTVQEYLDRQDFYSIVFFLSEDLNQLVQLQVNNWRLRANNHLKL